MNALGMIEVQSIPLGVNAGDAMLKAATVQLVTAQPVCAGKYIVIVTGEVSAVSESVAAGKAEAGYAYLLARLEPPRTSPAFGAYRMFAGKMYRWALNKADRAELITAIYLHVYENREGDTDGIQQ